MANPNAPKKPCIISDCANLAVGRGLCQHHYDQWHGKIRRERDKLRYKELPFIKFENPYRLNSGYYYIFEVLRTNKPQTMDQITRLAKIDLVKAGMNDYRIDYALEVLKAKKHSSKKGNYQVSVDEKGRWHLIKGGRG